MVDFNLSNEQNETKRIVARLQLQGCVLTRAKLEYVLCFFIMANNVILQL